MNSSRNGVDAYLGFYYIMFLFMFLYTILFKKTYFTLKFERHIHLDKICDHHETSDHLRNKVSFTWNILLYNE